MFVCASVCECPCVDVNLSFRSIVDFEPLALGIKHYLGILLDLGNDKVSRIGCDGLKQAKIVATIPCFEVTIVTLLIVLELKLAITTLRRTLSTVFGATGTIFVGEVGTRLVATFRRGAILKPPALGLFTIHQVIFVFVDAITALPFTGNGANAGARTFNAEIAVSAFVGIVTFETIFTNHETAFAGLSVADIALTGLKAGLLAHHDSHRVNAAGTVGFAFVVSGAWVSVIEVGTLFVFGAVASLLATADTVSAGVVFGAKLTIIATCGIVGEETTILGALTIGAGIAVIAGVLTLTVQAGTRPHAGEVEIAAGRTVCRRYRDANTPLRVRLAFPLLTLAKALSIAGRTGHGELHHALALQAIDPLASSQSRIIAIGIDVAGPNRCVRRRRDSIRGVGIWGTFFRHFRVRRLGAGRSEQCRNEQRDDSLHSNSSVSHRAVVRLGAEPKVIYANVGVN